MAASDGSPRRVKRNPALTAMDYWNAALRGFVPGGWNSQPPEATDMGDVPPFSEDVEDIVCPDPPVKQEQNIAPVPVVIYEDLTHTVKRVERFNFTQTVNVDITTPTLVVPRDPYRVQIILTNVGPNTIYLGHNESVGTGGFPVAINSVLVLGTTREIWAVSITALSQLGIIIETDRDTFER